MSFGREDNLDGGLDSTSRAQRLLVRVLLALRCEARRSDNPLADTARAELLADRIMQELPRRMIPVGVGALVVLGTFCAMPLVRDVVGERTNSVSHTTVASAFERGIRERGQEMNDGFATLRMVVQPFASPEFDEGSAAQETAEPLPEVAQAPFKKS